MRRIEKWHFVLLFPEAFLIIILLMVLAAYLKIPGLGWATLKVGGEQPKEEVIQNLVLEGKYFSLPYDSQYRVELHDENEAGFIERARLSGGKPLSRKISVNVSDLVSSFDEASAVKLRRTYPDQYTEQAINIAGAGAREFTKEGSGFEKTILWAVGSRLYSLTFASPVNNDKIKAEYEKIVGEFTLP